MISRTRALRLTISLFTAALMMVGVTATGVGAAAVESDGAVVASETGETSSDSAPGEQHDTDVLDQQGGDLETSETPVDAPDPVAVELEEVGEETSQQMNPEAVVPAITAAATTAELSVSTAAAVEGDSLVLTAKTTPGVDGRVEFMSNGRALVPSVEVAEGVARHTVSTLKAGTYAFSAVFSPADAVTFEASTSKTISVVVRAQSGIDSKQVLVTSGTLTWGVKDSWRSYVNGPIAAGRITVTAPATVAGNNLVTWQEGRSEGVVDVDKGSGTITYRGTMRSEGHAGLGAGNGYGLDQELKDMQIRLTSATTATLSAEVTQSQYSAFPRMTGQRVELAKLQFTKQALQSGAVVAQAKFTQAGAAVYGNSTSNYRENAAVDNVVFSLNGKAPKGTTTTVSASSRQVIEGNNVEITAVVSPDVAGTMTFRRDGKQLAVKSTSGGTATTTLTQPKVGTYTVEAQFRPSSAAFAASQSSAIVTVLARPTPPPEPPAGSRREGSLTWGVSLAMANYATGPIAKGAVVTSGVGGGASGYVFPQAASGSWDQSSHTGSIQYTGSVRFTGHKGLLDVGVSNPTITVEAGGNGTISGGGQNWQLDLAAASKQVGPDGSVTWSGVPVIGSFSGGASGGGQYTLAIDPLTFTVGAPSQVSFGSTTTEKSKPKRTAATSAPATTGVRVLTDAAKLKQGGRIQLEADGFEPDDEGVLVVLYGAEGAEPVVLDEEATADKSGTVTWSGTLPKDISGKAVITVQGSINAGAVIKILEPKEASRQSLPTPGQVEEERVRAAGLVATNPAGEASNWEWWASAGGLVAIAACLTLLVVRQRRLAA